MNEQLSVSLPLDIIYVYGTVNGDEATFSLSSSGTWTAVVSKSIDGRYSVDITAYNSLGTATEYHTVIYYLDELITPKTDWTTSDYYNAVDVNRVEANTQHIAQLLESVGYTPVLSNVVVDWTIEGIPYLIGINRIESNIEALAEAFITPLGWGTTKNWSVSNGFDCNDANRLERNLQLINDLLLKAIDNFRYCGTLATGEEGEIY